MKPTLIVLAAGMGSRYGGLKQIEPVGPHGEIIMDYSIYDAIQAGFGKIVFLIKKENEALFRQTVGNRIEKHIPVEYVFQALEDLPTGFTVPEGRVKPWGTGHAVLCCKNAVDTPFSVINADDYYGATAFRLLFDFLQTAPDMGTVQQYCLIAYELGKTLSDKGYVSRGVCQVNGSGYLTGINEKTRIEHTPEGIGYSEDDGKTFTYLLPETPVSMQTWGFTPGLFQRLQDDFIHFLEINKGDLLKKEFFLPDVIGGMIKERQATVKALPCREQWYGITYPEDKQNVKDAIAKMVAAGKYPPNLWGGRE